VNATFTIAPSPDRKIAGIWHFIDANTPRRLTANLSSKVPTSTSARSVRNDHPKDPAVAPRSLARRWNSRKNHRQFTGRIRAFLFRCGLKGFDLEWNLPGMGHRLARPAGLSVRLGPTDRTRFALRASYGFAQSDQPLHDGHLHTC